MRFGGTGDERDARVCPQCGAEYVAGIETCSDCLLALVRPEDLSEEDPSHDVVTFDLSRWTAEQRELLVWRLPITHVRGELIGTSLHVASTDRSAAEELVAEIEAVDPLEPEELDDDDDENLPPSRIGSVAGPGQRIAGWLGDTIFGSILLTAALNLGLDIGGFSHAAVQTRLGIAAALMAAYRIVTVAVWGQTLGYRVVGIRVAAQRDWSSRNPGWPRSVARVAVIDIPRWLPLATPFGPTREILGWVTTLWIPIALAAALIDGEQRGLHDRLAGVVVVRTRDARSRLIANYRR